MPGLQLVMNADGQFPAAKKQGSLMDVTRMGRLPEGMQSGKSAVIIEMIDLNTGEIFVGQTSLDLLCAAALAFKAADEV